MTAATHYRFKFIVAMLVAVFVSAACFASCGDSAEASSLAPDPSANHSNTSPPSDNSIGESEFSEISDSSVEDGLGDVSDDVSKEPSENSGDTTDPSVDISEDDDSSFEPSDDKDDTSNNNDDTSDGEQNATPGGGKVDGDDGSSDKDTTSPGTSSGSGGTEDDTSSEPSEDNNDTSSGNGSSSGGSNSEKPVVHGDTPVVVTINGTEHALTSFEEASALIPFETAEKGYTITFKSGSLNDSLTLTSNGDGTYTSGSGTTFSAARVSNTFHNQWCRKCGTRTGDGTHGTCVSFTRDKDCPLCGEDCKKLACHTCDE